MQNEFFLLYSSFSTRSFQNDLAKYTKTQLNQFLDRDIVINEGAMWSIFGGIDSRLPWRWTSRNLWHPAKHYCDVIMGAMASQITSLTINHSIVHSVADQRKHQSSASLAFACGIHRWPVNASHKWPVTRKMFQFDDVIMVWIIDTRDTIVFHFQLNQSFPYMERWCLHNLSIIQFQILQRGKTSRCFHVDWWKTRMLYVNSLKERIIISI